MISPWVTPWNISDLADHELRGIELSYQQMTKGH
jgi:hypothetical protein